MPKRFLRRTKGVSVKCFGILNREPAPLSGETPACGATQQLTRSAIQCVRNGGVHQESHTRQARILQIVGDITFGKQALGVDPHANLIVTCDTQIIGYSDLTTIRQIAVSIQIAVGSNRQKTTTRKALQRGPRFGQYER